jgi:hypothetical protein
MVCQIKQWCIFPAPDFDIGKQSKKVLKLLKVPQNCPHVLFKRKNVTNKNKLSHTPSLAQFNKLYTEKPEKRVILVKY